MNTRSWDFDDVSVGDLCVRVLYGDNLIAAIDVPSFSFEAESKLDSVEMNYDYAQIKDSDVEITVYASMGGTTVTIDCVEDKYSFDFNQISIELVPKETFYEEKRAFPQVNVYTPALPYTNTTGMVLYSDQLYQQGLIFPLIDLQYADRVVQYAHDDSITFKHFLDLSRLEDVSNDAARAKQQKENSDLKKNGEKIRTSVPSKEYKVIHPQANCMRYYKDISNKDIIVPVLLWEESIDIDRTTVSRTDIATLEAFIECTEDYTARALRIFDIPHFYMHIDEILKLIDGNKIYLIFDFNTNFSENTVSKYIERILESFIKFGNSPSIVYLGAQFNQEDISIHKDDANRNYIFNDNPIEIYNYIRNEFSKNCKEGLENILKSCWYGDYCGFDRRTVTTGQARPTARVVLSSIDKSEYDKILVRRAFDPRDVTKTPDGRVRYGYTHSMTKLLGSIANPDSVIPKTYLNEDICDADEGLKSFGATSTTPAKVKTLCLRHNIFSVVYKYLNQTL